MKNRHLAAMIRTKISLYQAAIFIAVNVFISICLSISERLSPGQGAASIFGSGLA